MPTEKLYDMDAYATAFTARLVSGKDNTVVLNKTLFFPEEGGQTPDQGTLCIGDESYQVTDVKISPAGVITHTLDRPLPSSYLPAADKEAYTVTAVSGKIDFSHRFSNMQNHTGEHIFSGLVKSRFGFDNVGFHLSDSSVTMDYNGVLSEEDVRKIELLANEKIFENIPVRCYYPPADQLAAMTYRSKIDFTEGVRIVEIPGVDVCACCAPHVGSTAEVGILKVLSVTAWKGGVRLSILCGRRAFLDYRKKHEDAVSISHLLSSPVNDTVSAVARQKEELSQTGAALHRAEDALMAEQIRAVPSSLSHVCLFTGPMPNLALRNAVNLLTEGHDGFCGVFSGSDEAGYQFIIGSRRKDTRELCTLLRERFQAKGGGKPEMVQGSVAAAAEDIKKLFSAL